MFFSFSSVDWELVTVRSLAKHLSENLTSEASVTAVKHVHRKASNDSDSSVEHVAEDDRKVKMHVIN